MLTFLPHSGNMSLWNLVPQKGDELQMTDTKALCDRIKAKGLKFKVIAENLGITPYCLQRKINNENEFKVSEVDKLSSMLGLTLHETQAIFFS